MRRSVQSPKFALTAAAIWVLISTVFLEQYCSRVIDLRAAGHSVSAMNYARPVLWATLLVFWCWNGWKAWGRLRADRLRGE